MLETCNNLKRLGSCGTAKDHWKWWERSDLIVLFIELQKNWRALYDFEWILDESTKWLTPVNWPLCGCTFLRIMLSKEGLFIVAGIQCEQMKKKNWKEERFDGHRSKQTFFVALKNFVRQSKNKSFSRSNTNLIWPRTNGYCNVH